MMARRAPVHLVKPLKDAIQLIGGMPMPVSATSSVSASALWRSRTVTRLQQV